MVISFFGHKDYYYDDAVKAAAYSFVRKVAKGQVSFFVGCYGGFDKMSYDLAVRFKKEVDNTAKIVFVTPYLDEKYLLYKTEIVPFDEVLYPPLESVPKRLSILKRNEYVVEKSDYIVFFVDHDFGGAGDGHCKKKRQVFHKPCRKTIGSAQRGIKTKKFFRAKRTLCAKNIEINLFTVL